MPHWGQGPKRGDYIEYKYPQTYTEDFSYIFLPDTKYIEVSGVKSRIIDTTKKD